MKYLEINLKDNNKKTVIDSLKVSKIVMGTDYFGTTVPEKDAFRLLDVFTDAGGNCIDTARSYAFWLPNGEGASERTIGRWLKTKRNRNSIIISTKGGHPLSREQMNISRLSRKEIESDLDESLLTLGVDHIDIYWLHRDDESRPVEDIMETLSLLVAKGKIRACGCSNWKTKRIDEANRFAVNNGLVAFCASQIQWSLATSTPDAYGDSTIVCMDEVEYKWYADNSFPVFAFSSQAKGFFAKAAAAGLEAINEKAKERFCTPENIVRLERVKEYARRNGLTPTAVVLGYITCNRVPAVAIVGCKNEAQLMDTLTAADTHIPEEDVNWLFIG